MTDTTFSIEFQGLLLPDEFKRQLEAALRNAALAEIAKTDLGQGFTVKPLPRTSDRAFPQRPILGFVLQKAGLSAERSPVSSEPSLLFTPPDSVTRALALFRPPSTPCVPAAGTVTTDVLEAVYYRPDVRAAIASNSRTFAELLSRDTQALQVFSDLTGAGSDGERLGPLAAVGVVVGATFAVGVAAGYLVNRHK